MREIVLDTETTGLDSQPGPRLVEVGCVELLNRIPTRDVPRLFESGPDMPAKLSPFTACRSSS